MAEIPNCFDKAEYYFEDAMRSYCELYGKNEADLTDGDYEEIMKYAGNHIGFFITWVIRRGQLGSMHRSNPDAMAAAEKVKTGEMLGIDFLMEYCDGRLYPEDMFDETVSFAVKIYDDYFRIYSEFVINELYDLPLEFIGSWEDYLAFEPVLDRLYKDTVMSDNSGGDSPAPENEGQGTGGLFEGKWKLL
ncbi:MAG: hypothetical protein K2N72_09470 [Oscillospiraceae bacterium]|nr:hypothetical protein [Oscillospiraceae bacterium]